MIKTILVPAMGNETDVAAFAVALRAARSFAAHLDVLHVRLDTIEAAVAMSRRWRGRRSVLWADRAAGAGGPRARGESPAHLL